MAVRRLDDAKQPFLEALEMPEATFGTQGFALPDIDTINLDRVRFYLDLDLDELTTHFGDRQVPYDVEDCPPYGQVLVASDSDEIVGVNIPRFLTSALRRYPELASALKFATVISGDTVVANPITANESSTPPEWLLMEDLRGAVAASVQALMID